MRPFRNATFALLTLFLMQLGPLTISGCAQKPDNTQETKQVPAPEIEGISPKSDVPYVPTPQNVVNRMLEVANVSEDDVIYDLGSGDGRIVITAAQKYGARGVGIDIDPERVKEARANAKEAGVTDLVEFRQGDLFEADLSDATVVTLYLLPSVNVELRPKLFNELEPGTPVVSHDFNMGEWQPERTVEVNGNTIYRWTIPEQVPEHLRSE